MDGIWMVYGWYMDGIWYMVYPIFRSIYHPSSMISNLPWGAKPPEGEFLEGGLMCCCWTIPMFWTTWTRVADRVGTVGPFFNVLPLKQAELIVTIGSELRCFRWSAGVHRIWVDLGFFSTEKVCCYQWQQLLNSLDMFRMRFCGRYLKIRHGISNL